jgi:hypothetical protein
VAPQRVTRVGRIGDYTTGAQDVSRQPHEARLRVQRVNCEELGHWNDRSDYPDI